MRALVYDHPNGPVNVREVADPAPADDGVVVQVTATGLCRSDWHAWAGHEVVPTPHIPGHELAGVITAVGSQVRRWHVGDRVTTPFVEGCGACEWCERGAAQVCPNQQQPGFTHDGSFAEYVALHAADTNLVAIPDTVTDVAAAALGCRFATAYRALMSRANVRPGEWVCIVGMGGVGLSALMIAVAQGARVIAIDQHRGALDFALALGAEHAMTTDGELVTVDSCPHGPRVSEGSRAPSGAASAVAAVTGGGAHISIDAVGHEGACAVAIMSLRRHGRHVQIGLLPPIPDHPRVPMDRVLAWELDLLGSHGMAAADYRPMMSAVARGDLDPRRLVQRVTGLQEAAELLPRVHDSRSTGMTIIDPRR